MPGTAFPEGQEPDDGTASDSTVDAIRHELESILGTEPVANSQRGWQSGGGATGSIPFGGTGIREHDAEQDAANPGARVQKWADVAMWQAPEHTDPQRPKVTIVTVTPDPLGIMAVVNAQYTGRNLTSPSQVTDDERREAWHAATVSRLSETPLESIQWQINFENVSRAFTHQLVRTRMATYAQESQRFAVKTGERGVLRDSTKLPPSLAGTLEWQEFQAEMERQGVDPQKNTPKEQLWRNMWDSALDVVETAVANMVDSGMPAEDARGLLPTNILTRVHMRVDMKTLLNLAGMRLCTQAQFEWRAVFAELAKAIRIYGVPRRPEYQWQYELIADSFRPVCYAVGHCPMKAKSDRHCSIQKRVDAFAEIGRDSSTWNRSWAGKGQTVTAAQGVGRGADDKPVKINAIHPAEWLADPTAARVAPGQEK